jgi:hypothetical protein
MTDEWEDAPAASEPLLPVPGRTPPPLRPHATTEWGDADLSIAPEEISQDPDYPPAPSTPMSPPAASLPTPALDVPIAVTEVAPSTSPGSASLEPIPAGTQVGIAPLQVPAPTPVAQAPVPRVSPVPLPPAPAVVPALSVSGEDGWSDAPEAHPGIAPASVSSSDHDEWSEAPVAGGAIPTVPGRALDDVAQAGRQNAGIAMPVVTVPPAFPQVGPSRDLEITVPVAGAPVNPVGIRSPEANPAPVPVIDLDRDPEDSSPGDDSAVLVPKARTTPSGSAPKKNKAAQDAGKGKKRRRGGNMLGGIRLTARDMKILGFLARYRVATVGQLARRFETSETALRNRLPGLERAGLLSWAWAAQTKPKVWLITDAGLATVGMNLTVPTVRWGQLRHTLGLVDLGVAFELAGETVLTEREIRAAATRYTPTARMRTAIDFFRTVESIEEGTDPTVERIRTALTVPVAGRGFGHIPDMVLARQQYPNGASGSIAVELELTRKGLSEWKTVLTAYRDSPVFAEIYYYVMSSDIKRGLEGVVKALGASDKIHIIAFTPIDLTADPGVTGGGA